MATNDENIQQNVIQEMRWNSRLQPNEIGVIVTAGVVTLTGYVDSYAKKLAAEEAASRIRGVQAVANDIEVRLPGMGEHTDTDLAQTVRDVLLWDGEVPANNIRVTVSNGWVTLNGEVEHAYQKEAAEREVTHLAGIKGVSNLIIVKPSVALGEVKQDIEQALVRNARTDFKNIQVEVEGRKVILSGTVSSYPEKDEAEDTAWAEPGVTEVENNLFVA